MPQGREVVLLCEIVSELNGSFIMRILTVAVIELVGSLYLDPMPSDHD